MKAYATVSFSYDVHDSEYDKLTRKAIQEVEESLLASNVSAYLQWADDLTVQVDVATAD